ncbi:MAG: YceD family protein [Armatimonadota bacterium]
MKIDLSEIARNIGKQATHDVDEQCDPEELGFHCTEPITGQLRFSNTGSLLLISGDIKTSVKLECGRCISEFAEPLKVKISEEFQLENEGDAVQILPIDEEDEYAAKVIDNNFLDVRELARQNLVLELPIQPLCSTECKGLCPTCGENLNVRQCPCPPPDNESPFKALAGLLDEEEKEQ